ncbi:MAG: DUF4350 domain-containing protein [Gammaproteobacteria bacterium]|nr:DUF4350 domain-containing protein [Gammaproteobacteria bacterium]
MKDKIMLGVLIAMLTGAAATWFFATHERVEIKERTATAPEVRANRYFGFFRYLASHDIAGENIYNLNTRTQLPDTKDTIILDTDTSGMTTQEHDHILDWVAEGGQLLIRQPYFHDDSLLLAMGIANDAEDVNDASEPGSEPATDLDRAIEQLPIPGHWTSDPDQLDPDQLNPDQLKPEPDSPLTDKINERREYPAYLVHRGETLLGELQFPLLLLRPLDAARPLLWSMSIAPANLPQNGKPHFAIGFRYGLGFVTILGEIQQVANEHFYLGDNSFIMREALTSNRSPGNVWIVSSVTRPDLWSLLWWRSAHVILWGALGVIFFFWWAGHRFGRVSPDPPAARREFQEHIAAGGRFLWRARQQDELLRTTRDSLLHTIQRRYPHFEVADASERRALLEKELGKNIKLWDIAMQPHTELSKHQFVEQVKALQTLQELL